VVYNITFSGGLMLTLGTNNILKFYPKEKKQELEETMLVKKRLTSSVFT
jgi:hypothetical protein